MGRGFILCAVACSVLALAVYSGLFEPLGIPASGAVFFLLALCLLFHGMSVYLLRGSGGVKPEGHEAAAAGGERAERGESLARHE